MVKPMVYRDSIANHTADVISIDLLEKATWEQIEKANEAVEANLDEAGNPKYQSAFGYACALTAIMQMDAD